MMRRRWLATVLIVLALSCAFTCNPASAERLIVSVSNHRVTVTPNYSGEELVLFGSVERDASTPASRTSYDLVVTNDAFRSAFVRLRVERGLYREETSAVTFLTPTLFRTGIPLPAEVPIGTYQVEIRLFSEGALIARTDTAFEIVKVGFEQFVATTARQDGLIYGLVTAFMALMTGWMASIVFRKD
jgi:hypothetical protein